MFDVYNNVIAEKIIIYRKGIVIATLFLLIAAILSLPNLKISVLFSDYFPNDDPDLKFYTQVKEELGHDEESLIIALKTTGSLFETEHLKVVQSLSRTLQRLQNVENCSDITNLQYYQKPFFGFISRNYLKFDSLSTRIIDQSRLISDSFYTQRFYHPKSNSILLYLSLKEDLSNDQIDQTFNSIDQTINSNYVGGYHILGRKYLESEYRKLVSNELKSSILYTIGIIVLVLIWSFRSVAGVIFPLFTMIIAMLFLYGFLSVSGRNLGIMSNLFPTIVLIVGISDMIHLLSKYDLEKAKGLSRVDSIRVVIKEIGSSLLLTSATTALGFLTLCTSSMKAISDFGLEAAIAVFIAFVVTIFLVPSLILILRLNIHLNPSWNVKIWAPIAEKIIKIINNRTRSIWMISLFILVISFVGISKLNFNNLQLSNIPLDNQLRQDFHFFDQELGASRSFELIVSSADSLGLRNVENLIKLQTVHEYLVSQSEISNIVSPVSWYHGITKVYNRTFEFPSISTVQNTLNRYVEELPNGFFPNRWKMVNTSEDMGRFHGWIPDIGRLETNKLNSRILQWVDSQESLKGLEFRITGSDHMIDKGHEHRIKNMISGLILALLVVGFLIGIIFKNIRMVLISLLINTLPLIIVAGCMGFLGIEMRGSTSILFAIGFVIAVDDTIHFLNKFRLETNRLNSINVSINTTIRETGKAMSLTTIILVAGFLILLHSASWDVYVLGILVSVMLFAALITDLFLLPVMLQSFYKNGK